MVMPESRVRVNRTVRIRRDPSLARKMVGEVGSNHSEARKAERVSGETAGELPSERRSSKNPQRGKYETVDEGFHNLEIRAVMAMQPSIVPQQTMP